MSPGGRTVAPGSMVPGWSTGDRDPLTGTLSRPSLNLSGARPGIARGAVVLVDLQGLRGINHLYGTDAGDEVLVTVAGRLRALRDGTVTVARVNGGEFALLLDEHDPSGAERLGHDARAAIRRPVAAAGRTMLVDASVGVAGGDAGEPTSELLGRAEIALHQAKAHGRTPRVAIYDPHVHADELEAQALGTDLRNAVTDGELQLHFQPIVNMVTRTTVGCEALLRWSHPIRGTVPPMRFIPVAEAEGLMPEIGGWVLERACEQARAWGEQLAAAPYVTVNLSVRQLEQPEFVEDFEATLARTGAKPHQLKVELTETVLARDIATVCRPLEALRELGVGVLLDDFGTGYSSLGYLRELPLDGVKLDQIFTRDLTVSTGAWKLARSVLGTVAQQGLVIIAEGLETAAHLAQLRSLGCTIGQGYYFGRPAPTEELSLGPETEALR